MANKSHAKLGAQKASSSATGSAAAPQTEGSKCRDWLRLVIMVENTESNRKRADLLIAEARRLAERFDGRKIVKGEALQIFDMVVSKAELPPTEAQPNSEVRHGGE